MLFGNIVSVFVFKIHLQDGSNVSPPRAEPKCTTNKRPIREIASDESDDDELNNKIMAKFWLEKMLKKFVTILLFSKAVTQNLIQSP